MNAYILVIDGGTTNVRVTLLNGQGEIISVIQKEAGVSHTAVDGHNGRLKNALQEAIHTHMEQYQLAAGDIKRCIAYGMITSREGLLEIPHCIAPVDESGLRLAVVCRIFPEIAPFPVSFIPGVRNFSGQVDLENFPRMDMMRGEEAEAIGLWQLAKPCRDCVFVLPGSHNKFVRMDAQGHILGCMTTMSGEFLSVLTHHTILSGAVGHAFSSEETYDREMALAGFYEAERIGFGRAAFAGRILSTLGKLPPDKIASYLLGAVLQTDARALKTYNEIGAPLYIAGKEPVKCALLDVLDAAGFEGVTAVSKDACARMGLEGALRIAGV